MKRRRCAVRTASERGGIPFRDSSRLDRGVHEDVTAFWTPRSGRGKSGPDESERRVSSPVYGGSADPDLIRGGDGGGPFGHCGPSPPPRAEGRVFFIVRLRARVRKIRGARIRSPVDFNPAFDYFPPLATAKRLRKASEKAFGHESPLVP
jgi:hypothetical protein